MEEIEDTAPRAPAGGLFRSLSNLLATLIGIAQTRFELLTTELQEEIQHAAGLLVWGFIALLSAGVGLVFVGITVIVVYWDTNRVLAAIWVTAAFLALAAIAITVLVVRIRRKPRLLDATRTELAKDRAELESRL
ncbi:MAG: phage holin family protein [Phycisphaerales bacterium]|nr:phage holin family protein [Phycisphaerales bacterium]